MIVPGQTRFAALVLIALFVSGCFGTPGTKVTGATMAVYTAGATRDTVSVRLPKPPAAVYGGINDLIEEEPNAEVMHRNERSYLVEVAWSGRSLTAQATELGPDETLLFLWVDAGDTGLTAKEVASSTLRQLCSKLNVEYTLVEY